MRELRKNLRLLNQDIGSAIARGQIGGVPLAGYASDAAEIFLGFSVLVDLIRASHLQGGDDDEVPEDPLLNGYEEGALLGLIQASSQLMARRAAELDDWAQEQMQKGAA